MGGPSNHWTTGHPNVTSKTCMRLYDAYFPDLAGIRSLTPDPVLGGFRWWKTIPNWPSITQGFERSRTRSCCRTGHAGSRDTLQWWARHLPLLDERWERLETCQPAGGPNSQPSSTCRMFQEGLFWNGEMTNDLVKIQVPAINPWPKSLPSSHFTLFYSHGSFSSMIDRFWPIRNDGFFSMWFFSRWSLQYLSLRWHISLQYMPPFPMKKTHEIPLLNHNFQFIKP